MDLQNQLKKLLEEYPIEKLELKCIYRNYKENISERKFIPLRFSYGSNEYHKEEQWLLHVFDLDKKDYRTYALKDIRDWTKV